MRGELVTETFDYDGGRPVTVYIPPQAPAAIVFLKSSGITEPKQLEGKKLGSAANDATFKLFPIFAQHTGNIGQKDQPVRLPARRHCHRH